jgi:glyoxylase-like metal-dependent hydrolase (beta-lactamase superfamily II)
MIDCGADWLGEVDRVAPDVIVLTHAHPDHAGGLRKGAALADSQDATRSSVDCGA